MIRFLRWCLGLDPIDLWRQLHQEDQALITLLKERESEHYRQTVQMRNELASNAGQLRRTEREAAQLRHQLTVEQNTRGLYEQVLIEAGEQIIKNAGVSPQTLLGVLKDAFVTAVATGAEWRDLGASAPSEVINTRARLANALLPEPDRSRDRGGMTTQRKRDGRVGDSDRQPSPDRAHLYEYPFGSPDSNRCAVPGCGKDIFDPVHRTARQGFSVERRPDDGPPETLPPKGESGGEQ